MFISNLGKISQRFCSSLHLPNAKVTALFEAIKNLDPEAVDQNLSPDSANAHSDRKITPLHYAAGSGLSAALRFPAKPHKAIVRKLLNAGAKLDALDVDGRTPLDVAASTGHTGLVQQFLNAGGRATDQTFRYAISRITNFCPFFSLENALLDSGKNLDISSHLAHLICDITPFATLAHEALINEVYPLTQNYSRQIISNYVPTLGQRVNYLIEQGADADQLVEGKTLLHHCFERMDNTPTRRYHDIALRSAATVLAENMKDVFSTDEHGWTLLHWAVYSGHVDAVKMLSQKGLSFAASDNNNLTPKDLAYLNLQPSLFEAVGTPMPKHFSPEAALLIMKKLPPIGPLSTSALGATTHFPYWGTNFSTPGYVYPIDTSVKGWDHPDRTNPPISSAILYWPSKPMVGRYSYATKRNEEAEYAFEYKNRLFTTALIGNPLLLNRVGFEISKLYSHGEDTTRMANYILQQDLKGINQLLGKGWHVLIDKDTATFHTLQYGNGVLNFSDAFTSCVHSSDHVEFAGEVLNLMESFPSCGVSLFSELYAACDARIFSQAWDVTKISFLLQNGLTSSYFRDKTGQDLATFLRANAAQWKGPGGIELDPNPYIEAAEHLIAKIH